MSKSLNDFPKDVRDTVYQILAKAAERKARAMKEKVDKPA